MSTETIVKSTNGTASTSLVLGILGLIIPSVIPSIGIIGILCAIVAIILGIIALGKISKSHEKGKGMAIAGIILGVIPLLLIVVGLMLGPIIGNVFSEINSSMGGY